MSDFLDEVKQDLKDEQLSNCIKKHGPFILGLMTVFIVGAIAKLWWVDYQKNKVYKDASLYISAIYKMRSYSPNEAVEKFKDLYENGSTAYKAVAGLHLGSYYEYKGEYEKSLEKFQEVAADNRSSSISDLANYNAIKTNIISNDGDISESINKLEDYIADNGIFKHSAQELLASLYIKSGNLVRAKELIDITITDLSVPESIRERLTNIRALTY